MRRQNITPRLVGRGRRDGAPAAEPLPESDRGTMAVVERTDESRGCSGWLLDEVASAGRENLDAAHVDRYDRKMDSRALDEIDLLRSAGLGSSSVVVDLGSGTGQFALTVAPVCQRVVAVDPSPVMVQRLRRKLGEEAIDNVEITAAGFLTYDHTGEPADIVYSRYALHHLPDFWKVIALRRVHSMLRPGGVFRLWDVVYDFDVDEVHERIEAWCQAFGEEVEGDWARWELEEHIRDEHSTFTWLLEAMFERTGFTIESTDYSDDGFDAKYILRATWSSVT